MEFGTAPSEIDRMIVNIFKGNPVGKHINYYQDFDNERSQTMYYDGYIKAVYPSHLQMIVYGKHENFSMSINKRDLLDNARVVVLS